ncbi:hypothetical protein JL857_24395 [Vibrio parahaemolyticus]|uniref:hypothetical protein n=1 Tax=Vibrio parahaemolyticus TaxID=670 RepID=UPI001B8404C1|nr:hypothetical protein [Vibrio parahaemolyticus]MCI9697171.1 hypothetical protein [Vibrio parahaemolyticus]MCI9711772.1 hypothetical protein [Vibrio parahaemolyticus]MCI9716642.1 hypothetical protein [Vibrio parahaemolyticus]MCR9722398.1 hypothetical protein [Vibrio parahaemolyticus]MCR9948060.1 hypothetical protein [Vibrio parahaemolyticus]
MKVYKLEWRLLVGAFFFSGISLFLDYHLGRTDLFMRSGAVVVLLAAIVEYRTSSHILKDIQNAIRKNVAKDAAIDWMLEDKSQFNEFLKAITVLPPAPTQERKHISFFAHIFLVLGTVIWGYGDLWF